MGKIHELPKSSSRLLTSAQIITSVYCVVKELIENSLDSSSKNVEVKLEDYGLEKIEVKDNGCGIDQYDLQFVAKPHCTSKIDSYSDLNKVETYGFRGEALSAICTVADLVITTKSNIENFGSIVNFGPSGQAISCRPCPCAQGTTVAVLNLFKNVPVRRQFYRSDKNKKEALCKIEDLLISYGCIQTDVRFALYHNKNLIWQKPALTSTKNSLIHILGNSVVDNLKYVEHIDEQNQRKIEAYLPKLGASLTCGLSSSSKCITAINRRPVRIKAIDKLLKDYYNKAIQNSGRARYPICYLSFTTLLTEVDVNVEPNKTTVMLHHSEEILEQFSEMLKYFYCCDSNDDNINAVSSENSLPASESKSNTPEFLNRLKVKSDIKLQQSKLNVVNGSFSPIGNKSDKECNVDNSFSSCDALTKKDIIEVGSLKEPSKKKLKTSSSKKDIENHINTLSNFFAGETQTSFNKTTSISTNFVHNVPSVTVERVCSNPINENSLQTNNKVISNELEKTSSLSSNLVPSNYAVDINNISNFNKMEKITTFGLTSNVLPKNNSKDNNNDFDNQQNRISTFSLAANVSPNNNSNGNNNVLNTDKQENITTFDVRSSMFLNKITEDNNNVNEKHLSDSSMQMLQMKNGLVQNPLTDNNIQKCENWSRGIQPSSEQMQPVAVLQPKVISSKCSLKKTNDQNFDENVPLDNAIENNHKRTEKDHSNSKKSFEKKHPIPEEKLTPFDMFCQNHRLEVAAENPNYNTQQIAQIMFEKWKGLSAEERAVFEKMLVHKDFQQNIKKKERLGKIISRNLNEDVKNKTSKTLTEKLKPEVKTIDVPCSIEKIKSYYLNKNRIKSMHEDLSIVNYLAPGIWVCAQKEKLYLLNTFRLQETIIYHRLLDTYEFDTEPLEIPEPLLANNLGEDAILILMQLSNSSIGKSETINDERLTANGFVIKFTMGGRSDISFELIRIASCIAFYGVPDLKELLLLIKEKGISSKLSLCRPSKIDLFLQSEANRMSRSSPACQRRQDVEDLLNQRSKLPVNCNSCIHHKPFFSEIWKL